ncbi:hypothetical protein AKJ16_DCAP07351 [Drosera capensis]
MPCSSPPQLSRRLTQQPHRPQPLSRCLSASQSAISTTKFVILDVVDDRCRGWWLNGGGDVLRRWLRALLEGLLNC